MAKFTARVASKELLIPIFAAIALITNCLIVNQKKLFWNDELMSYYLLSDNSVTHMLIAFHDKISNAPPLYFIIGWLWAGIFGSAPVSLRIFSSIAFALALCITWKTLRRVYSFAAASIGTLAVFCSAPEIIWQN